MSKRSSSLLASLVFALMLVGVIEPATADAGGVVRFATLPKPGPGFPEGIAADAAGRIYVSTFDFSTDNVVYVFNRNGHLAETISLPGVVPLGLEFDAAGNLYVANFGGGNVLKFVPPFNSGSLPAQVFPVCAGFPTCGLNAITFDAAGDLYVSDSFGGNVFKLDLPAGTLSTFVSDELLKPAPPPHGFPGFGANGLAFDTVGANLYIANTADDRILKYNLASAALSTFAESVNGADGIAFDRKGRLWVAANQADELVALNRNGRVVERRGSFEGVGRDGAAKGLLFPASIVISRGSIYVTNLALALTPAVGDEPEEDVTTYTVSRIPLHGH
ncbi:MAG TPA: NHL repeat-containing protein [Burkholderiales bacterium]|nr:NHL repeat-containing protein [Burkholderiales bacterium]